MKYQWTDWITHVPGQELPIGTYALFEFWGVAKNGRVPYTKEGLITAEQRGHRSWYARGPDDPRSCMITRYKLRSVVDEIEVFRKMLADPPKQVVDA